MKSVEWQQKMLRGNMRATRLKDKEHSERRNKKLPEHRAKYTTRLKKSSSSILTASTYSVNDNEESTGTEKIYLVKKYNERILKLTF